MSPPRWVGYADGTPGTAAGWAPVRARTHRDMGVRSMDVTSGPSRDELATLLHRAARGDLDSFGDFVDATVPKAFELVRAMGCRADEAAELLQGCYQDAWAHLAEYAAAELSPLAWLLARVQAQVPRAA